MGVEVGKTTSLPGLTTKTILHQEHPFGLLLIGEEFISKMF
jgi:hypothetical protein